MQPLRTLSALLITYEPHLVKQWRLYLYKQALTYVAALLRQPAIKQVLQLHMEKRHRILVGNPTTLNLLLVGCGGTGSFAAHILAQFAVWAQLQGLDVRLVFIDPDTVETKNLVRQNFCQAEIGYPKAFTLAWRYTAAFGVQITPVVNRFSAQVLTEHSQNLVSNNNLTVIIGAVDNVQARRDIAAAVTERAKYTSKLWWIDAGNERAAGQVLAGNSTEAEALLSPLGFCTATPYPHIQEPTLLSNRDRPQGEDLSCADLGLLAEQSAMINRQMATWIGVYLYRLLQSKDLDLMATWIDLDGGAVRSTPITGGRLVTPDPAPLRRIQVATPETPLRRQIPVDTAPEEFEELEFGLPGCPSCGDGTVIEGQDNYYGALVTVYFCDSCDYRELVCPQCGGEIEDTTRRDERGHPAPVVRCTECPWSHDISDGPRPPDYRPGVE